MSQAFAALRELLSKRPTRKRWKQLVARLDSWKEPSTKQQAIAYVQNHLQEWPITTCSVFGRKKESCAWSIAKHLTLTTMNPAILSSLQKHPQITSLTFSNTLEDLAFLRDLPWLTHLHLKRCGFLLDLSPLEALQNLQSLELSASYYIEYLPEIGWLPSLTSLVLHDFTQLQDMDFLLPSSPLETLELHGCSELSDVRGLVGADNLHSLWILGAVSIPEQQRPNQTRMSSRECVAVYQRRLKELF